MRNKEMLKWIKKLYLEYGIFAMIRTLLLMPNNINTFDQIWECDLVEDFETKIKEEA